MFTKFSKVFSLLLIIALLAPWGAGSALAQDMTSTPGAGPGDALMPADGVVSIGPGQWQWYVFRSQVPVSVEDDDEDVVTDPADATVNAALRVRSGNVDFEVWSANDLNNWYNDSDFDPMGVGTTNEFLPGDPLFWEGSFEGNSNYYLIVMNRSAQTSYYALDITGDVAFPSTLALSTGMEAVAQTQEPAVASEEMALTVDMPAEAAEGTPAMTSQVGFDAASAAMPAAGVVRIAPGQWQWYTFSSQALEPAADNEDVKPGVVNFETATIDAALRVQSGNVDFEVWSLDDLNDWANSVEFEPTGAGTTNEFLPGDPLFWQGSFEGRYTFYLIVMNRGTEPATYSLDITGDVGFPSAATFAVN